jgi:putative PIN family toxin of toxin-antitoxin system
VLDTNAWLDLLVFRDPRAARLDAAVRAGEIVAVVDEACRAEWQRVLDYPALALDADRRAAIEAEFEHFSRRVDSASPPLPLPRCQDPDDQKFLELALASGARWLVTRDRALLTLARRVSRAGWFDIVEPGGWTLGGDATRSA